METRPLSATKRWRLVEVLERAKYEPTFSRELPLERPPAFRVFFMGWWTDAGGVEDVVVERTADSFTLGGDPIEQLL